MVTLFWVLFISAIASCQQEEITLSTYYPAPYGEYDELCAEKLLVWEPIATELQYMVEGDCHIGNSLIVGAGGTGFSYEEIAGSLADGTVLIKGNVGIGYASLGSGYVTGKLEVDGDIALQTAINDVRANILTGGTLQLKATDDSHRIIIRGNSSTNAINEINIIERGDIGFHAGATSEVETNTMWLKSTGNVGIGTPVPVAPLTVERNADVYLGHIIAVVDSGDNDAVLALATATQFEDAAIFLDKSDLNKLKIALGNTDFTADRNTATKLTIQQGGNVGIGTTSPQAKLHVEGEAIIAGGLRPDYDSGWFVINATSNQTYTLNHNLGSIPTRVAIYVANSSTPTWVQPCNFLSRGVNYQSPENVWMSNTQFIVNICYADPAIYVDANNPAPPGSGIVTSETGYMRVLLWK